MPNSTRVQQASSLNGDTPAVQQAVRAQQGKSQRGKSDTPATCWFQNTASNTHCLTISTSTPAGVLQRLLLC
jgi:hypothetical protein